MMIATILLLINFGFLFFKEETLFSFKHFFWIYPVEIIVYIIIWFIGMKVGEKWMERK